MFKPRRKKTVARRIDRISRGDTHPASHDQQLFEALEQRTLLSVSLDGGLLSITGSPGDDAITVSVSMTGSVTVTGDPDGEDGVFADVQVIEIDGGGGSDQVTLEGDPIYGDKIAVGEDDGSVEVNWKNLSKIDVFLDNVETLTIDTLGGNDAVVVKDLSGTALVSSDTLEINGGAGKDKLIAKKSGIDVDLSGGDGKDVLIGGVGDDDLSGGEGKDKLIGGDGDDNMAGDGGDDKINGGKGDDVIDGGAGRDKLIGSDGVDDISGGTGEDKINGGKGDDTIDGGDGDDKISGSGGNDSIDGGDGDDKIRGGGGDDLLDGGAGADDINGSGGTDIVLEDDEDDVSGSDTDGEVFAVLLGDFIVPDPVDTDARGIAFFEAEDEESDSPSIEIEIFLHGLDLDGEQTPDNPDDDVTGIHLHMAAFGENGPHVFDIITGFDEAGDPISDDLDDLDIDAEHGRLRSTWDGDESHDDGDRVVDILMSEATAFYLVIHTEGNPGGELRGQLKDDRPVDEPLDDSSFAFLLGENIFPTPVVTDASGDAFFDVEGEGSASPSILIDIALDGLDLDGLQTPGDASDDVTGIHIHRGAAGENGPHVFDIITGFDGAGDPISDDLDDLMINAAEGTVLSVWDNDESHDDGDRVADVLDTEDEFYIVVHTVGNPAGELRGQIEDTDAGGGEPGGEPGDDFEDDLSFSVLIGEKISPDPVVTEAEGLAKVEVQDEGSATPSIKFEIELDELDLDGLQTPDDADDDVTGIHLHRGAEGVNGPHVFDIITGFDGAGDPISDDLDDLMIFAAEGKVLSVWDNDESHDGGDTVADLLASDDDDFYIVVHTVGNPGGEIRGQVGDVTFADLTGDSVVPDPVVTDIEGFALFLTHDEDTATPSMEIDVELDEVDLDGDQTPDDADDDVTAIHIHRGGPGVTGPSVFDIITGFDGAGDPISDDLDDLMIFADKGSVLSIWDNDESHEDGDRVLDILASEDEFYVDIHTVGHPDGAVRGQIITDSDDEV